MCFYVLGFDLEPFKSFHSFVFNTMKKTNPNLRSMLSFFVYFFLQFFLTYFETFLNFKVLKKVFQRALEKLFNRNKQENISIAFLS